MKISKRLSVATALAALALAATAAIASAAVWKDHGTNVTTTIEIGFSGAEFFEAAEGGMQCGETFTLKTSGGSSGQITKFQIDKSECPTVGALAGCELSTAEPKGLPWTVDVNESDLTITSMRIKRTFKAGCPIAELDKTIDSTVTLRSPSEITEVETLGSTTGYKAFGSFTVDEPSSGTYGIG